jgi:peptide/nickel transport system ATP-binding protein
MSEPTRAEPLLDVANLSIEVLTGGGWTAITRDVSFQVDRGETVCLVGESGCGKSTTALAMLGLLPAGSSRVASGTVTLDGQDLYRLSRRGWEDVRGEQISMIFQEPMSSLHPAFTVGEQIAESLRRHRGMHHRAARRRAVELLDLVGVPDAAHRLDSYPHEFSGGMRQRVLIAIALACEPRLLVADEPTTALDVTVQAQILDLLQDMREQFGLSILLVTHDLGVVAEVADRVVVMYAGEVVEQASVADFLHRPAHPYSRALTAASTPQPGGELTWIPGAPPPPEAMPPGCRFHPRCQYGMDECTRVPVVPLTIGPDRRGYRCLRDTATLDAPAGRS